MNNEIVWKLFISMYVQWVRLCYSSQSLRLDFHNSPFSFSFRAFQDALHTLRSSACLKMCVLHKLFRLNTIFFLLWDTFYMKSVNKMNFLFGVFFSCWISNLVAFFFLMLSSFLDMYTQVAEIFVNAWHYLVFAVLTLSTLLLRCFACFLLQTPCLLLADRRLLSPSVDLLSSPASNLACFCTMLMDALTLIALSRIYLFVDNQQFSPFRSHPKRPYSWYCSFGRNRGTWVHHRVQAMGWELLGPVSLKKRRWGGMRSCLGMKNKPGFLLEIQSRLIRSLTFGVCGRWTTSVGRVP